jgi:hypothetical protein
VLRNSGTGAFQVYDISNNAIVASSSLGTVGSNWQFAGFGNFSSNPGETDMILRNTNTGGPSPPLPIGAKLAGALAQPRERLRCKPHEPCSQSNEPFDSRRVPSIDSFGRTRK